MQRLLPGLDFLGIHVTFALIAKAPANAHIRIGRLELVKIFAAYPARFIAILAIHGIAKQLQRVVDVVRNHCGIFAG